MSSKSVSRTCLLLGSAAACALASAPAYAQQAPASEPVTEVIVTGSRINRVLENSPQPIQVVTAESLKSQGITQVADILDRLPALIASDSTAQANGGAATLNLRGMGNNRTLVLVNGRRHVAGVPGSAAVDISTIPSALIERVDVLTGGASAVYGADAVTGVVNFITKKRFKGFEVEGSYNISTEGDAPELFLSGVYGRDFADGKGNVIFALQASRSEGINYGDRDFSKGNGTANDYANPALYFQAGDPIPAGRTASQVLGRTILLSGSPRFANTDAGLISRAQSASPRVFRSNPRFSISSTSSLIGITYQDVYPSGPGGYATEFDLDGNGASDCRESANGRNGYGCWIVDPVTGQVRSFRDGLFAGGSNQFGGDGAAETFDNQSITPDNTAINANLMLNYELNDRTRLFAELKIAQNTGATYNPYNTFDDSIQISLDNPFIPQALRTAIATEAAARGRNVADYGLAVGRDHIDLYNPKSESTRRTYRAVFGIEGEFSNDWAYELTFNYGRTENDFKTTRRMEDRFFAAVDAVIDPATGQPTCRVNLNPATKPVTSGLYDNSFSPFDIKTFDPAKKECRPINLFGLGKSSAESLAFIGHNATDSSKITQTVIGGSITGDSEQWFSLPGGPLAFAVGIEYRKETSDFTPDAFTQAGYGFQFTKTGRTKGEYDSTEAFLETSLPLLKDLPFADDVTLSLAYRAGEYSTIGNISTWKADLMWAVNDSLKIRGGKAKTVRAPNISELFSPLSSATFRPVDPCDAANIGRGTSPAQRTANCRAAGIPVGWTDPLTARFVGEAGGNPKLQEETSNSYTYGIVVTPSFVPGLSFTADYWNIEIENAIAAVSAQDIVNSCYDAPSLSNQYCALIRRNTTTTSPTYLGFTYLRQVQLNFSGLEAAGVDFNLRYRFNLDDLGLNNWGKVNMALEGSYLDKRNNFPFVQEPNRPNPQKEELNRPTWAINPSISWSREALSVNWYATHMTKQTLPGVEIETSKDWSPAFADAVWIHGLSASYKLSDKATLYGGINNLTNETPFVGSVATPVSAVGRNVFVRVNAKF